MDTTWIIVLVCFGVAVVSLFLFRAWLQKGTCHTTARVDGKTIIITGANTGCGKETARELGKRGGRIILACRDIGKAAAAADELRQDNGGVYIVKSLDLASAASIREFCDDIIKTETYIHILINNAGVMMCPQWQTEDGHEMQFGVNHLGHFLLTLSLLPLLTQTPSARIVNLSSLAHKRGKIHFDDVNLTNNYSSTKAYSQSKLANILFTKELAQRLKVAQHLDKVSVYAVHPGVVNTELGRHIPAIFRFIGYKIVGPFLFKSCVQGAQTTLYCALDEELAHQTGKYYSDCAETTPTRRAQNMDDARKLWDLSLKAVNIKDPTAAA